MKLSFQQIKSSSKTTQINIAQTMNIKGGDSIVIDVSGNFIVIDDFSGI